MAWHNSVCCAFYATLLRHTTLYNSASCEPTNIPRFAWHPFNVSAASSRGPWIATPQNVYSPRNPNGGQTVRKSPAPRRCLPSLLRVRWTSDLVKKLKQTPDSNPLHPKSPPPPHSWLLHAHWSQTSTTSNTTHIFSPNTSSADLSCHWYR